MGHFCGDPLLSQKLAFLSNRSTLSKVLHKFQRMTIGIFYVEAAIPNPIITELFRNFYALRRQVIAHTFNIVCLYGDMIQPI